jgi:hypothetical protein
MDVGTPAWVEAAIAPGNHTQLRVPRLTDARGWNRGDFIAGVVTAVTPTRLVVAVEAGYIENEALEAGEWVSLNAYLPSVVKAWIAQTRPQPGERVFVQMRGKRGSGRSAAYTVDCAVAREAKARAEAAPWE